MGTGSGLVQTAVLVGILVAGAAVPGVSVLLVAARAAGSGLRHGAAAALGIAAGDAVFIVAAVYGLAAVARWSPAAMDVVHAAGGAWLLWLGWRHGAPVPAAMALAPGYNGSGSLAGSFATGLVVTLGDQKALVFYLGIFPALYDLSALRPVETAALALLAVVAVGGTKLAWAVAAARGMRMLQRPVLVRGLNRLAGTMLMAAGVVLWLRLV